MDNTDKERFESLWNDFVILVKGKLITTSNTQRLSTPLANLILSDAASSWGSEYELCGKWLSQFAEREPQKAELIRNITLNDMKFSDISERKEISNQYNIIVPAIGAIAGLGISYFMGAAKWVQAISVIAPAVLLYPAVKSFAKQKNDINKKNTIDELMGQLDKYKNSILSVLS